LISLIIPILACQQTYVSAINLTNTANPAVPVTSTATITPILPTYTTASTSTGTPTLTPFLISTSTHQITVTATSSINGKPTISATAKPRIIYYTQSGDTLPSIAVRFGVSIDQIETSTENVPHSGLITPNTLLVIPDVLSEVGPREKLFRIVKSFIPLLLWILILMRSSNM